MQKYAKVTPFKLGELTGEGWIREQLSRNRDGIGGHLDELEPLMMLTPYTERRTEKNWGGAGWGAEISGNYWYGQSRLYFNRWRRWICSGGSCIPCVGKGSGVNAGAAAARCAKSARNGRNEDTPVCEHRGNLLT